MAYNGGVSCLYNWHNIIKRVINITTTMTYEEQFLGGYWFLRVLFCTIFYGICFFEFFNPHKNPKHRLNCTLSNCYIHSSGQSSVTFRANDIHELLSYNFLCRWENFYWCPINFIT